MISAKLIKTLGRASAEVTLARKRRGPLHSEWSWFFEMANSVLRHVMREAMEAKDPAKEREVFNEYHVPSHGLLNVWFDTSDFERVKGRWITPKMGHSHRVIFYLHGGGYVFYSKYHDNLMAWISHYTGARLFALDYPLAPENPFPSALNYALESYRYFLDRYADAKEIILMGDSAGGGLVLSLLQKIKEAGLESPEKAVLLSPWVDLSDTDHVTLDNHPYDWIDGRMGRQWASWYAKDESLTHPLISPLFSDLKLDTEIYVQYGSHEAIREQIQRLLQKAAASGLKLEVDTFEGMNHVFQYFGDMVPQSKTALQKIKAFLDKKPSESSDPSSIRAS